MGIADQSGDNGKRQHGDQLKALLIHGLHFADMVIPVPLQVRGELLQLPHTLRPRPSEARRQYAAQDRRIDKPRPPVLRVCKGEEGADQASADHGRQPNRSQCVAAWCAIGDGREDQITKPGANREGDTVSAEPRCLIAVGNPARDECCSGEREIGDHLQPDDQRKRGGDARKDTSAPLFGVRNGRDQKRCEGQLPAVVINPQGSKHRHQHLGRSEHPNRENPRSGANQTPRNQPDR